MHVDEEQLQRILHGEATSPGTREHVAACPECRSRLDEARQEEAAVFTLLEEVDGPAPSVRAEDVALQAELSSAVSRRHGSDWLRRAAAVALVVGIAGAAYAIPGSPVRAWVRSIVEQLRGPEERVGPGAPPDSDSSARTGASGVALSPGERLVILFEAAPGGGEAKVSLTDGREVQVRAPAGAATFTSSSGYLLIVPRASSATFEIRIPRSAPWVEVRTGDQRVFLKDGPRITTSAGSGQATEPETQPGGYLLRLPPRPVPDRP